MKAARLAVTALLALGAGAAGAQTPPPATPPVVVSPAGQTDATVDQRDRTTPTTEGARRTDSRSQRGFGSRPIFPHQIKDEGIKMPKCAQESREGEACSK